MKSPILSMILLTCLISCSYAKELKIKDDFSLKVREPSDLTYDGNNDSFWTVSDENATLYEISNKGKILDKIKIDAYDLEAIALSEDGTFYVLDEYYKELIILNSGGEEENRIKLDIPSAPNNGPEGICLDEEHSIIYILNEKNPGLLQSYDYEGNKLKEYLLDFAPDYSGICYDSSRDGFWIVSDEARRLYFATLENAVEAEYKLDISNPEGVALNKKGHIYIVSDGEETLYRMEDPE